MSDALFDAEPYGPEAKRRAKPRDPVQHMVGNSGQWFLLLRRKKNPHEHAHLLDMKMMTTYRNGKAVLTGWDGRSRWEGAWKTMCGEIGAVVAIEAETVNACPKCLKP